MSVPAPDGGASRGGGATDGAEGGTPAGIFCAEAPLAPPAPTLAQVAPPTAAKAAPVTGQARLPAGLAALVAALACPPVALAPHLAVLPPPPATVAPSRAALGLPRAVHTPSSAALAPPLAVMVAPAAEVAPPPTAVEAPHAVQAPPAAEVVAPSAQMAAPATGLAPPLVAQTGAVVAPAPPAAVTAPPTAVIAPLYIPPVRSPEAIAPVANEMAQSAHPPALLAPPPPPLRRLSPRRMAALPTVVVLPLELRLGFWRVGQLPRRLRRVPLHGVGRPASEHPGAFPFTFLATKTKPLVTALHRPSPQRAPLWTLQNCWASGRYPQAWRGVSPWDSMVYVVCVTCTLPSGMRLLRCPVGTCFTFHAWRSGLRQPMPVPSTSSECLMAVHNIH